MKPCHAPGMWQWTSYQQKHYRLWCDELCGIQNAFDNDMWEFWHKMYGAAQSVYVKILYADNVPDDYALMKAELWLARMVRDTPKDRYGYYVYMEGLGHSLDYMRDVEARDYYNRK